MPVKQAKGSKGTADRYFSMAVRSIGHCEACMRRDSLTCSHIISRRYIRTRTSFRNAHSLCFSCHRYFTDNPIAFTEWVMTTSLGEYTDSERIKAYSTTLPKPDWQQRTDIAKQILAGTITLEQARTEDL